MGRGLATWLLVTAVLAVPASPREVVQTAVTEVVAVLEETPPPAAGRSPQTRAGRWSEVRRIAGDLFDFDEMARRTLSRHWAARSPVERAEFVELVTALFERTFLGKVEHFAGQPIAYTGEVVDGRYAVVRSRITTAQSEIALDYRLHRRDDGWKVYDVLVDGVSFVSTYRSQFNRVVQSSSYEALVEALQKRRMEARVSDRL
jgi:phospholipid transport system substrate-binding protein